MQKIFKATLAAAALLALTPAAHAANPGVNVGTLECHVSGGWGHVIASDQDMNCVFRPTDGGPEHYHGQLKRYGVDIGYTNDARLVRAARRRRPTHPGGSRGAPRSPAR